MNQCSWRVTGKANLPAGTYTLRLTISDGEGGTTDKDVTLVVEVEEAEVTFDDGNPVAVKVIRAGSNSGPFTFSVCISERDADLAGDIGLARVSMSLVPVGPGGPIAGTPAAQSGGSCYTFSFNNVPVNTYTVLVTAEGGYYAGTGEDVLVIYDPSLEFHHRRRLVLLAGHGGRGLWRGQDQFRLHDEVQQEGGAGARQLAAHPAPERWDDLPGQEQRVVRLGLEPEQQRGDGLGIVQRQEHLSGAGMVTASRQLSSRSMWRTVTNRGRAPIDRSRRIQRN